MRLQTFVVPIAPEADTPVGMTNAVLTMTTSPTAVEASTPNTVSTNAPALPIAVPSPVVPEVPVSVTDVGMDTTTDPTAPLLMYPLRMSHAQGL